MDSALTPREIQNRIRAGESLAEVAEAAGMPPEKLSVFTAPVLAEREHIVQQAKEGLVRRRGDSTHRPLMQVIEERLFARRLDPDELVWDSFRLANRSWRVIARLEHGELTKEATFSFDPRGRYSLAENVDARWMIGEDPPPGAKGPDNENTVDLDDELALVRATTEEVPLDQGDANEESHDYSPAEIAEVDGLYDIVGPHQSQLDVLYEMLSGISEDSVRIYQALVNAEGDPSEHEQVKNPTQPKDPVPTTGAIAAQAEQKLETPSEDDQDIHGEIDDLEPSQESLIDVPDPPQTAKPKKRRRRASVPTWDDILFGSPKKD